MPTIPCARFIASEKFEYSCELYPNICIYIINEMFGFELLMIVANIYTDHVGMYMYNMSVHALYRVFTWR